MVLFGAAGAAAGMFAAVTAVCFSFMVVMAAEKIAPHREPARRERFRRGSDVARRSADDFDPGPCQGVDGAAADAAGNQHIDFFGGEEVGERAVAAVAGGETAFGGNRAVFDGEDGKFQGVSEMLKHLVVLAGDRDFHGSSPLLFAEFQSLTLVFALMFGRTGEKITHAVAFQAVVNLLAAFFGDHDLVLAQDVEVLGDR